MKAQFYKIWLNLKKPFLNIVKFHDILLDFIKFLFNSVKDQKILAKFA